ncbi:MULTISPECIES: T9SS type A sorting domain-containing protein [unclassified Aureispira]|uniref:T9SS type A sorting domain-containing protein n=1 Tax=unclassified Aureispira TaxID=2649989 RepID=UPI000697EB23|nr:MULTISPECIES: T9SS type A sorting domain-containing protein [unclassified Aureispira]WMX14655.1 T9SS type A sorting domain-containing protein [Aureispira sp. CCB-E]
MKSLLSILLLLISATSIQAQLWATEITPYIIPLPPPNSESELKGYDIQETNDGNYVFAGNHRFGVSSNYTYTPMLVKIDATTGNVLWQQAYEQFNGGYMQEVSVIEKPNGNLLMAGLNYNEIFLVETDAAGDTVQTTTYLSACALVNNVDCNLHTVRLRSTTDGNYIIGVGATGGLIGIPNPINELFKISPNHTIIWRKNYDRCYLLDFQPTSDGGYVFSGGSASNQAILFKVDANGDSLWQQPYTNIPVYDLHSVKETPDGGFVVVGYISGFAGNNPYVYKLDATGTTEAWSLILGPEQGKAHHVTVDPTGNCVVTGTKQVSHGGMLGVMLPAAFASKISPSGTVLQDQIFDDLIDNSSRAIRYTSDGNFVIAGSHGNSMGDQDLGYVVKTGYTLNTINVAGNNNQVSVFPNPFEQQTTIKVAKGNNQIMELEVYDALGRSVKVDYSTNNNQIVLSRGSLTAGVYWFSLRGDGQLIETGKLMIQ